ncbi:MAG TPA: aquaporin [Candidatus Limnocylindrales bacterium]|nr:aquaporin [Candidatus Limnocylindrales bacterium]
MNASKYLAEIVGTFVLVFVGSLSILAALAMDAPVLVVVPLGFGLALLAAIFAVGDVSGGHFNPAVTLAAFLDRRIRIVDAVMYVIAQALGAIAASGSVLAIWSQDAVGATVNAPGNGIGDIRAFALEAILTALFVLVILTVTKRDPGHAPIAIPLTLVAIHLAGIPVSGASVNPVRSLGPALVGGDLAHLWVYLTAPFVGAAVGWVLFRVFERAEL